MHRDAVIADYGPGFAGIAVKSGNRIVCVVPPQVNRRVRQSMRQNLRELGVDCGECRHCPIGSPS